MSRKLSEKRPDLRSLYHPSNDLSFDDLYLTSSKRVAWICEKDSSHVFTSRISHRAENKAPCSVCKYYENRLVDISPAVAKEYSPKNDIPVDEVKNSTNKKVLWECSKGHEWESTVANRTRSVESICPQCKHEKISLLKNCPELKNHYSSRNDVSFDKLTIKSNKKFLWECSKGHVFASSVHMFTQKHKGFQCLQCVKEDNLLCTKNAGLKEFYSSENDIPFEEVTIGHGKKVLWVCSIGHKHKALAAQVMKADVYRCAQCKKEENLLSKFFPEVEVEYSDKNEISFNEITRGSNRGIIWVCKNNHQWIVSPKNRFDVENSYVSPCPQCKKDENLVCSKFPELKDTYSDSNKYSFEELTTGMHEMVDIVCTKGHKRMQYVYNFIKYPDCPHCKRWGTSKGEEDLIAYVKSILPKDVVVEENTRKVISPYELDIYIPDKNIAIEFNGLFWHSEENGKDRNYHKNKWAQCKQNGVQLISVWEDDWRDRNAIVKNMLAHKLGVSRQEKIFARNTYVDTVSKVDARDFCNNNHIQGFVPGSFYLGLFDKNSDKLVAISIWRKLKDTLYLDRYCTSLTLPGGMGKLLKAGKEKAVELNMGYIVTFADREISDGSLYEKLGFIEDKVLKVDYKYIYRNTRVHKFNFRKKRFENDKDLVYKDGLTESELANLNGLHKVWDCGKIRYVLNL